MSEITTFEFPEITDEEIRWVSRLLGLREDAFYGEDVVDPRKDVLKCKESIDVSACPGSGKTTLLVAKLGILGEKWRYHTRGICVLSHTNAARKVIEARLGNTTAGRRLFNYPHFIGTIHGFINEFLALPWLRFKGYPVKFIDDVFVEKKRRELIKRNKKFIALKNWLEKSEKYENKVDDWIVSSPQFDVRKRNGESVFKKPSQTSKQLKSLVEYVISAGYHRHLEMLMWAEDLISHIPNMEYVIRDRFPILFIDEAQDNSEEQSKILYRIFMEGDNPVIRQRFGDSNQAIFDFFEAKEATTDKFPNDKIKKDIPNSYRFGQSIADLADPLGLNPSNIKGHGPKNPLTSGLSEGKHTIFIFDEDKTDKVLDAYAELLLETFSEQELSKGTFTAIGQVHKKKRDDKKPRHIGHYWHGYDPDISHRDPKPKTFVQYIGAGIGTVNAINESFPIVEKVAEGILRLAGMSKNLNIHFNRRHFHRYLLQLLENDPYAKENYVNCISKITMFRELPTEKIWNIKGKEFIRKIAESAAGTSLSGPDVEDFLKWGQETPLSNKQSPVSDNRNNTFNFKKNDKEVFIRLGSVHSVKGETHTATLVLETFWNDHNLEKLLDWLKGEKRGIDSKTPRQQTRLKIHYVAMTRPSHLLCLAMKSDSFKNFQRDLDKLRNRGWQKKQI